MKYCKKCVMPETTEGASFDKNGRCKGCQAQDVKAKIDWSKRRKELDKIMSKAKNNKAAYDCIVPISGGKDSVYQLHVVCKEYGLKPLAVTFNHGGFTKTGLWNLWNCLDKFNIDHVQFSLNNDLIKRIQKRSIETIGDYCWHCHNMVSSFTLQMAQTYKIPLVIWGESGAEYGHQGADYNNIVKFDKDYFQKLSSKMSPKEFACSYVPYRDIQVCEVCDDDEFEIEGIHIGNYIPWDVEGQVETIERLYGWRQREIGGSYKKYKSIECSFEPMHEHLCLLKRGFARTSLQASQEVRDGIISRDKAFKLITQYERILPKFLSYYLQRIGITQKNLAKIIAPLKHPKNNSKFLLRKEWRECREDGIPFAERFLNDEVF